MAVGAGGKLAPRDDDEAEEGMVATLVTKQLFVLPGELIAIVRVATLVPVLMEVASLSVIAFVQVQMLDIV